MSATPIPAACAHRPRRGGLVVPYLSFEHNDAVAFGTADPIKRDRCFEHRLCQICENPLERRFYVVVRPQDVGFGYAPEPGLHPPCLQYSEQACPMLNGTAETYREGGVSRSHPALRTCADPDCRRCAAGFGQRGPERTASAAPDWDAWMLPLDAYQLRRDGRKILGISLDLAPLRIRRILVSPERESALRMIAALADLGR
ncbi:hypothetical protein [Streptomyces sp. NPDC059743]|uniref:hypothetical protein n=1 Tax=Streptomyces sp. NPDC059743 TaxID=3346928 RepID=UPI00365FEE7B